MDNHPRIFVSYAWSNSKYTDVIETDFSTAGIPIIRDKNSIKYTGSLKEFMDSIRFSDFVIALISPDYLKSKNCMYELTSVFKDIDYRNKICPIIVEPTKFYDVNGKIEYIKYWEEKKRMLNDKSAELEPMNALSIFKELKLIDQIYDQIDEILDFLSDSLNKNLDELRNDNYRPLLDRMGINEISHLSKLLEISKLKNDEQKMIALDEYEEKYAPNTFTYYFRAHNSVLNKEYLRAEVYYKKSLEHDENNSESLFRLGELYLAYLNKPEEAIKLLHAAVEINPKNEGALLDIGLYYFNILGDYETAAEYADKVIEINPRNEKGYNNLGGCYVMMDMKSKTYTYKEKVKSLILKSLEINPRYYDGLMSYGGYYIYYENNLERGREIQIMALSLRENKDIGSSSVLINDSTGEIKIILDN
ncbi:MAG: TIR domain-containing protein [Saprospiraceae bacterium]|nr:TIR domain-containing protein [Saprospiraceae bacterium]MCB9322157.1 TIR domain-containing protein [Lewinellaceae bacterium]